MTTLACFFVCDDGGDVDGRGYRSPTSWTHAGRVGVASQGDVAKVTPSGACGHGRGGGRGMQRTPRDVLPNQPRKERVSNPTIYPSAHVMTAAIFFWRVDHDVDGRSRAAQVLHPLGGGAWRRRRSLFRIVHARGLNS